MSEDRCVVQFMVTAEKALTYSESDQIRFQLEMDGVQELILDAEDAAVSLDTILIEGLKVVLSKDINMSPLSPSKQQEWRRKRNNLFGKVLNM